MQELLPDIRQLSDSYEFQQDSAPTHWACETVDLLTKETTDCDAWPPNSPDLNPVDYKVVSNAEGIQETDQGCRRTALAYPDSMGRT